MSNKVQQILEEHGPMLSGEIARIYEERFHVSNENARKVVSRAASPVEKLKTLPFDKNQKFFYLKKQFMSNNYCEQLLYCLQNYSKTIWLYILAFRTQRGFVSKKMLSSIVPSPVSPVRGHKTHEQILSKLQASRIIEKYEEDYFALNDMFCDNKDFDYAKGIEFVKQQAVLDVSSWLAKLNFIGYNSRKYFHESDFAHFKWGLSAPSYISPPYNFKSKQPGFLIADIFYGKKANIDDISFFIEKLKIIRNFKGLPSFFPIFIAENLTEEAFQELKNNKVMIGNIGNIFSKQYTEILKEIVFIFQNSLNILEKQPEKIENLFKEIAKAEGRFNDIVGDLFEFVVGYYYSQIGCKSLNMKKKIFPNTAEQRELDILVEKDGKIIVIECKATRSPQEIDFVKRWVNETIPIARRWLSENYPSPHNNVVFELWSIGGFSEEANAFLDKSKSTKKYELHYYNRKDIIQKVKESNIQVLMDVLKHYYTNKV